MEIVKAHSYLTRPAKSLSQQPPISGAELQQGTNLYQMLYKIAVKSDTECDIDIAFRSDTQQNTVRDMVVRYLSDPSLDTGRNLAFCLQSNTTKRSGMGLVFLVAGKSRNKKLLLISRFPADAGILAEERGDALDVELVEKVFMKNEKTYKSALYTDQSLSSGFWKGRVADKQIDSTDTGVSDYWVKGFLQSDFRTTSSYGTRRLALALKDAVNNVENIDVRTELLAAAQLAGNLDNKTVSINRFFDRYNLSDGARDAVKACVKNSESLAETFRFSISVFQSNLRIRHLVLDTGATLMGPVDRFSAIFSNEALEDGRVRFSAEGMVVKDAVRKS